LNATACCTCAFAQRGAGGSGTALASARLSADLKRLDDVKVIFSQSPKVGGSNHFGCRIVEARDGTLFLALGDRYSQMANAQTLDNHHGKVVRMNKDGSVPRDNPFAGRAGALPEIWSYGHRNMQGATLAPDGVLWTHEHGPQGGDEINLPKAGLNHGWPVITHGENYGGGRIGDGQTATRRHGAAAALLGPVDRALGHGFPRPATATVRDEGQPVCGFAEVPVSQPHRAGRWQGGARSRIDIGERVRDVRQGPDGLLYVLTDSRAGRLLRLLP
jgi:glucose/arabinose dehydrogenase